MSQSSLFLKVKLKQFDCLGSVSWGGGCISEFSNYEFISLNYEVKVTFSIKNIIIYILN